MDTQADTNEVVELKITEEVLKSMDTVIGTKMIKSLPMDECSYLTTYKNKDCSNRETRAGYLVVYEDNYISWSPKDVFEKAYRLTVGMTLGLAIEAMKMGKKVARSGWNRKGMWCEIQVPDENSKMTKPYMFITVPGDMDIIVPRTPVQTDMLADDWFIV